MIHKYSALTLMIGISFVVTAGYSEYALAQTNSTTNATESSAPITQPNSTTNATKVPLTSAQKYKNGYNDGLKNSQADFQNGQCNPTVPTDVVHSREYKQGYTDGYSKGPCRSQASPSSNSSSTG